MFNPDKTDYPQNANGQPEFSSVIVTVDSISLQAEGDDVTQKLVLSTQDPITALSKISAYFGEPALLAQPSNAQLLMEAGRAQHPVFVYLTPREGTSQIVTSSLTLDMLVQDPAFGAGSTLLAIEKLTEVAANTLGQFAEFAGGFPNLLLLTLTDSEDEPEVGSNDRVAQPDNASSKGGRGKTAKSLRETADVQKV